MKKYQCFSFFVMGLFVLMTRDAHAYLDPGTGSALLQGLIAALATLAITAKLYWYRILRFLGIGKKEDDGVLKHENNKVNEGKITDDKKE